MKFLLSSKCVYTSARAQTTAPEAEGGIVDDGGGAGIVYGPIGPRGAQTLRRKNTYDKYTSPPPPTTAAATDRINIVI